MIPPANDTPAHTLRAGLKSSFQRKITRGDIETFASVSGDWNPLHIDDHYASTTNYKKPIVHGAFQVGLASAFVGMHLPGLRVLLGSINARFPKPLYYPCAVSVEGELVSWNSSMANGLARIKVIDAAAGEITAEINMGVSLHDKKNAIVESQSHKDERVLHPNNGRKKLLVAGAGGGIGSSLVRKLAKDYDIIGIVNRTPMDDDMLALPGISQIQADLMGDGWYQEIDSVIGSQQLWGIVYCAWPGLPRGGLLDAPQALLDAQIRFGGVVAIGLARLLAARAGPAGGRFVAVSSIAGNRKPVLTLAAYSLGKGILETTVRLLAPEMARKKISINAICPTFIPIGMNRQMGERQQMLESARIPMGRLCSPDDLINTTAFLLDSSSSFISGEVIALSGGQL